MQPFVHLHLHTEYSLLDGFARIGSLFERCKTLGMTSVAITDHGVMFGAVDFYKEAKKHGIKPIIGCEVYVAPRSRFDRAGAMDKSGYHLVLLAMNEVGYRNLIHLVSMGYLQGFYYRPRIDDALLREHSEGLIALSACLAGEIQVLLSENRYQQAKEKAEYYDRLFGRNHFYLELQDHFIEEQKYVNQQLVKLGRETGIPLVATNDVHYLNKEDHESHDVLLCIQTGKTLADADRMRFPTREFYLKSGDEMAELFPYAPEAIENTLHIAELCNLEFQFGTHHLPEFPKIQGETAGKILRRLCEEGLKTRYPSPGPELLERLDFELKTIEEMGYEDYFLIVWDFIKYAKDRGILVGPGRGSCGGSIVAYVLRITDVDPINYGLIFERFLNPERVTMPDIDIDFQDDRRQEVIDYVISKYGKDKVAQIITFGTLGARAAIRDVGRVSNMSYAEVDRIAKMIPFSLGMTIDKALEVNKDLKAITEADAQAGKLINTARSLEGVPRHASTHAAGVVISKKTVDQYVPLYVQDDNITTQYNMSLLEELGLLKMDFLGLRTLTVIQETLEQVQRSHGVHIDLEKLPLDDPKPFELISSGDTLGLFQLESPGMRRFMKELKPTSIEDIIAGISLYRPGPMESIPTYIYNKNHQDQIKYPHPLLEPILKVTYGCLVYQEQVMQVVRELAGYSYGRSDLVRRAMSKKKMSVMEKERQGFIHGEIDPDGNVVLDGCVRRGVPEDVANVIFDDMTAFANYAFNKSHAAGYALIAYQTAWLKAHYPVAFMAALMTSVMGNHGKIAQYIQDCRQMGISVLQPDVNSSLGKFSVEGDRIRYGLLGIKNVGDGIVRAIVAARKDRGIQGLVQFCDRVDTKELNKRAVESLIKAGAMDSFGVYRSQLLASYERLIDGVQHDKRRNVEGQMSLFGGDAELTGVVESNPHPDIDEFPSSYLLNFEKEMLGIYLSGHPLGEFETEIRQLQEVSIAELKESAQSQEEGSYRDGDQFVVAGMVSRKVEKVTRSNAVMAFVTIEDLTDTMETVIFPKTYEKSGQFLSVDSRVILSGVLNFREDEDPKLNVNVVYEMNAESFKMLAARSKRRGGSGGGAVRNDRQESPSVVRKLYIRFADRQAMDTAKLRALLAAQPGDVEVICYIEAEKTKFKAPDSLRVNVTEAFMRKLETEFGLSSVKYV